jgi:hypothetical protein
MHLKSRLLTRFFILSLIASLGHVRPADSAQCVNVSLLDSIGVIVPTEKPVVGMMIGDTLTFEGTFPPHATRVAGTQVPCPQILVDQVANLFSETCTTQDRRNAAVHTHGVTLEVIIKGCTDMSEALNEEN